MQPLTKKQKEVLDFMRQRMEEDGYAPSYAEIAEHFQFSSKATVAQYVETLQEKGYLTKDGTARGLAMVELPRAYPAALTLQLAGLITAGSPIEAVEEHETIAVPADFVRNEQASYVLRVKGDSMIEDGIFSGDYIVVEKAASAKDGDIVVALLENTYATVKRFYRERNRIRLQPANHTMQPIFAHDVAVQGIVRAVIRKY